ncbi:hypothetical protein HH310_22070 [Actinoplanes sp. TBRC 11911]|uniref:hypothetical protein n=1 Tax=Actinoplanes sp. TBRC 11911 TaxID=2729386 RepID=UPI00145F4428|nr:hypothetical protein [Actinoplanes sp. TBRC 11911]NMO53857.1 hypothetical protein [Actinoplanes sp. TBRC 11911]
MGGFVDAILNFPTVLFTPLLIVVIGYWCVVAFGGAETDPFGLPILVPASLFVLFAWFGCLAGNEFVPGWWVLPGAVLLALLLTVSLTVLIRRLLPKGAEPSRADFVGLPCVIRTSRVTDTFGQAEVHARDGSSAIVQVRQTGPDEMGAGTTALIYDVDPDGDFFWVIPADIATKGQ